jgi:hypothetical protein
MLLDEFEKSRVSGKKFAEKTGVGYQTFASWNPEAAAGAGRLRESARAQGCGAPEEAAMASCAKLSFSEGVFLT